jgi:hypothetical protein
VLAGSKLANSSCPGPEVNANDIVGKPNWVIIFMAIKAAKNFTYLLRLMDVIGFLFILIGN